MSDVLALTLKAGDSVDYYGRGIVVILRDAEPDTHPILGDGGYFKFWARAEDGHEGWIRFGPTGRITRLPNP